MAAVPSRELRNDTAGVLARVQAGEQVVITSRGRPVASIVPYAEGGRRWISREELTRRLSVSQADAGLRDDLAELTGETTDDLGPLE
jgi:prevent-host-death family protein